MRECDVTDAHAVRDVNGDKGAKAKRLLKFLGKHTKVFDMQITWKFMQDKVCE